MVVFTEPLAQPMARASMCIARGQWTKMLFSTVQSRPPPMKAARVTL